MGHILSSSLEKHFLAINKLEQSYDLYKTYHYYLIISPWKRELAHPLNKLESPFLKDALCHINLGEIGQVHLEKPCIFIMSILPPIGKGCGPQIWKKL